MILKRIHQTLDSWRDFIEEDWWRMELKNIVELKLGDYIQFEGAKKPPPTVKGAKRSISDMRTLEKLLERDKPPKWLVRALQSGMVWYGGG